jgi:hypothetical protein
MPADPNANAGYAIAAYVAAVILVGYDAPAVEDQK